MADFTFAIVVPLASPNQPVATSKDDTELASRPLISSELGASKISRWYPPRPASIAHRALCHALIWRVQCAIRRASVGTDRLVMQSEVFLGLRVIGAPDRQIDRLAVFLLACGIAIQHDRRSTSEKSEADPGQLEDSLRLSKANPGD